MFTTIPASSVTILIVSNCFCRELHSSSIKSMSFTNLRLYNIVSLILIPHLLSFRWSIILWRYAIKGSGDSKSPCLIPMSLRNYGPWIFLVRTAD